MAKRQRPPAVTKDNTKNAATTQKAVPRFDAAMASQPVPPLPGTYVPVPGGPIAPLPKGGNGTKPSVSAAAVEIDLSKRRVFDWSKVPFAVFKRTGAYPIAVCATLEEAIAALKKMPLSVQERAYIAEFKPVTIKTELSI